MCGADFCIENIGDLYRDSSSEPGTLVAVGGVYRGLSAGSEGPSPFAYRVDARGGFIQPLRRRSFHIADWRKRIGETPAEGWGFMNTLLEEGIVACRIGPEEACTPEDREHMKRLSEHHPVTVVTGQECPDEELPVREGERLSCAIVTDAVDWVILEGIPVYARDASCRP